MLARVYKLTDGKLPLIGVGGIDSGAAAVAKIKAGASLLQLYTGLVFEGPRLIGDIKQALLKAMQEARTESLSALVGSEADRCATLSAEHAIPTPNMYFGAGMGLNESNRSCAVPTQRGFIRRRKSGS